MLTGRKIKTLTVAALICYAVAPAAIAAKQGSFVADAKYDVAVFRFADLAVRYPKETFVPVLIYLSQPENAYFQQKPNISFQIYEDYSAVDMSSNAPEPAHITIEAFGPEARPELSKKFLSQNQVTKIEQKTLKDFCTATGITNTSSGGILEFFQYKAIHKKSGNAFPVFFWRTEKHSYWMGRKDDGKLEVDIGFLSLEPATPNVDLGDPTYQYYHW